MPSTVHILYDTCRPSSLNWNSYIINYWTFFHAFCGGMQQQPCSYSVVSWMKSLNHAQFKCALFQVENDLEKDTNTCRR